jgi:hypothetical protein
VHCLRAHSFTQTGKKEKKYLLTAEVMLAALKTRAHINTISVPSFEIIYLGFFLINDSERMWKDEVVAHYKIRLLFQQFPGGNEKNHEKLQLALGS